MKKLGVLLLIFIMMATLFAGCAKEESNLIGVSMPTKSLQRWNQDGANMKTELEKKGYKVELLYAEDSVDQQVKDLENMITKGCKVLVVASIDRSEERRVGKEC